MSLTSTVSACRTANCTATYGEALVFALSPFRTQIPLTGWAGSGVDLALLPQLLPSLLFGLVIFTAREALAAPLGQLGRRLGIHNTRRLRKFENQLWLALFYIVSTAFGYYVLRDETFFRLPLRSSDPASGAAASMWAEHPKKASPLTLFYYNYEIGFYLTELTTLFVFGKRSDFLEMAAHHAFTLFLLIFSHLGNMHRAGMYILFIHDASDIMLSVAKVIEYCRAPELVADCAFLLFITSFVFFRLYVFPSLVAATWGVGAKMMPCTYNFLGLLYVLHFLLQSLHVYWFGLIVRVALRMFGAHKTEAGDRRTKDVRSDSDAEEGEGHTSPHMKKDD